MSSSERKRGSKGRRWAPRTGLIVASTILSLALTEAFLRLTGTPYSLILQPETVRVLYPDPEHVPGIDGTARFIVNNMGLRATGTPADSALQIVALGGSTTECVFLDTQEAWPALVEEMLKGSVEAAVWVGNGGISGTSVRHHVGQAEAVLSMLPDLDVLILMVGGNDFLRYIQRDDRALMWYDDPQERVRVHYESFAVPRHPAVGRFYERAEITRLLRLTKRRLERAIASMRYAVDEDGRSYSMARTARGTATEVLDELPPLQEGLQSYRRDLNRIVAESKRYRVETVLVTQPALWAPEISAEHRRLLHMGGTSGARGVVQRTYYSVASLAEGMARYNAVLLEVCEEHSLHCVDLAKSVPRDTTIFYDDLHFNESGARYVASEITNAILSSLRLERG